VKLTHWACVCGSTHTTEDVAGSTTTYVECGCSRRMRRVEAPAKPQHPSRPDPARPRLRLLLALYRGRVSPSLVALVRARLVANTNNGGRR
jgi:hypothetical protein